MTFSSGPPCNPGKMALSMALAYSAEHTMAPPRGPRSVLWVVNVTTSATPTGDGWAPPAMSPAGCAASNRNFAPTESAISRNGIGSMIRAYAVEPATISFGRWVRARSATWSKSMISPGLSGSSVAGDTPYDTKFQILEVMDAGDPWVRCPPWSSRMASTVSPGSIRAW